MTPTPEEQALAALDDYHRGIQLLTQAAATLSNLLATEKEYRKLVDLNAAHAAAVTQIYQEFGNRVNNAVSKFHDPQGARHD